ncbi:MAG: ankyrin repeat domain-containing protein [Acidobacteriota bacterium]
MTNQDLFDAIHRNDLRSLTSALAGSAKVDGRDGSNRTPLYRVAEEGPEQAAEMAQQLLDAGARIDLKPTAKAWSALHHAAYHGDRALAAVLLEAGAQAGDQENGDRWAPLHLAINGEVVTLLLAAGADPEATDRAGSTPLLAAVVQQANVRASEDVRSRVQALLEAGCRLEVRDRDDNTPLLRAVKLPVPEALDLLIAAGADVQAGDFFSGSALHAAAAGDHAWAIRALAGGGAAIDSQEIENRLTPLALAAVLGRVRAVRALLAHGADPTIPDQQGKTAMDHARSDEIRGLLEAAPEPAEEP